jgi:hypothetical protein
MSGYNRSAVRAYTVHIICSLVGAQMLEPSSGKMALIPKPQL